MGIEEIRHSVSMDGFAPVIIIEGFLVLGVVVLLYVLHLREMKKIKAKKIQEARMAQATDTTNTTQTAEETPQKTAVNETQTDSVGQRVK
jgi:hypothetical protein